MAVPEEGTPWGDSAKRFTAKGLRPFCAPHGVAGCMANCGKRQTKCGMAEDPAEGMGWPGEVAAAPSPAGQETAGGTMPAKTTRPARTYVRESSRSFAYFTTGYTAERNAQRNPG